MVGEVAVGKAEARNRAAEAPRVDLIDREARREPCPAQRGAHRIGLHPDGAGRQHHETRRSGAAYLDGADHRAVGIDTARTGGALEARVAEMLAGDEMPGLFRIEFRRDRRRCSDDGRDNQDATTQHDSPPLRKPALTSLINSNLTITSRTMPGFGG